ncbi:MAG: helix-turn-helix domain-containing protein [Nitrospirae bacterium]|nr:helix-turn-helix domain-containing protein [Nitrospirota bacterium]
MIHGRDKIKPDRKIEECTKCQKYTTCTETCIYVELELTPLDFIDFRKSECENKIFRDYKEVLIEINEAMKCLTEIDIKKIRTINNVRLRAIAAMTYAGISIKEIAILLQTSLSQIYRIVSSGKSRVKHNAQKGHCDIEMCKC